MSAAGIALGGRDEEGGVTYARRYRAWTGVGTLCDDAIPFATDANLNFFSRTRCPAKRRNAFKRGVVRSEVAVGMTLHATTPASAWKPGRREDATEPWSEDRVSNRASASAPDAAPPTHECSNVKGPAAKRARAAPLDGDATPAGASGAWWGETMTRDSDDEDDVVGGFGRREFGAAPVAQPFSAARCARGRIAGDGACRCRLCEGDHERNRMVLLACPSNHPLCAQCAEAWASRRARTCPSCKEPFDGWHYGERDDATGAWTRRFRALSPRIPESAASGRGAGRNGNGDRVGTGRHRVPARSARALAFGAADLAAHSPPPDANAGGENPLETREKKRTRTPSPSRTPSRAEEEAILDEMLEDAANAAVVTETPTMRRKTTPAGFERSTPSRENVTPNATTTR